MSADIGYLQSKIRELKDSVELLETRLSNIKEDSEKVKKVNEEVVKTFEEIKKIKREIDEADIKKVATDLYETIKNKVMENNTKLIQSLGKETKLHLEKVIADSEDKRSEIARKIIEETLDVKWKILFTVLQKHGIEIDGADQNLIFGAEFNEHLEKFYKKNKKDFDKVLKSMQGENES